MRKQVVFSFGGINVLPALLTDFGRRGVLARALAPQLGQELRDPASGQLYVEVLSLHHLLLCLCLKRWALKEIWSIQVAVAVAGFAAGGIAMASPKVGSNVLVGLQGCSGGVSWSLLVARWRGVMLSPLLHCPYPFHMHRNAFSPSTEVAYAAITLHVVLAFPVPFHACAETLESVLGVREKVQAPETDCFRLRLR